MQVAESMRRIILSLYERHLSPDGKAVKYSALARDKEFLLFTVAASELQAVDLTPLSREQRMAFFLNTYNALIIHAQAALGGPSGLFGRCASLTDCLHCSFFTLMALRAGLEHRYYVVCQAENMELS